MTIGGHTERINLAITNLGKKDIYLGHDWLKHHNPSVNWKTQSIIFGCCMLMSLDFRGNGNTNSK